MEQQLLTSAVKVENTVAESNVGGGVRLGSRPAWWAPGANSRLPQPCRRPLLRRDVGTGFSAKDRRILRVQLEAIEQPTPPFTQPLAGDAGSSMRWVSAVYVGDIEYREFTGHLRHPSWKGLRDIPASTVG
ncbi:MAG: hypothetical protein DI630_23185 [Gordonia sp. (in: high G+C Gram-positive bacteria)]|nr:MAG: hypothetical protein DI630_23185 [Gordonia sp. (in: high G+C Gram-positive bacteria)]